MKDRNVEIAHGYDFGHEENMGTAFIGNGKESPVHAPIVDISQLQSEAMRGLLVNELRARANEAHRWNLEKEAALQKLGND